MRGRLRTILINRELSPEQLRTLKMITLKDAQIQAGIGKTTIYKYLKKLDIEKISQKGRSCITLADFEKIKAHAGIIPTNDSEQHERSGTIESGVLNERDQAGTIPNDQDEIDYVEKGGGSENTPYTDSKPSRTNSNDLEQELRNQIAELKHEKGTQQQKIEELTRDIGRWEGMNKVLERRILELEAPKSYTQHTEHQGTIIIPTEESPPDTKKKMTVEGQGTDKPKKTKAAQKKTPQKRKKLEKREMEKIKKEKKVSKNMKKNEWDEKQKAPPKPRGWFEKWFKKAA